MLKTRHVVPHQNLRERMFTATELAVDALSSHLASHIKQQFGSSDSRLADVISSVVRLALERIGDSDALYHNVEHTMLVTLAGHDILNGRATLSPISSADYGNFIAACLLHDVGYVRGILNGDDAEGCVIDQSGRKIRLPRGASDAALTPYHVDRSKLFVLNRIAQMESLDAGRIARAIEFTRFPGNTSTEVETSEEEGPLLRAADLIGQLGDPHYLRKANALFHEFEEVGLNKQYGYKSPADLIDQYSQFYWNSVSPHVQSAIRYLNVTPSGRQWVANLYSNVLRAESDRSVSQ
jgi:hypothetical protein